MQKLRLRVIGTVLLLAVATACKDAPRAQLPAANHHPDVLRTITLVPGSIITDTTTTEEVEQRSYFVGASTDSVARHFRAALTAAGWRLLSDNTDSALVNLYLQKDGHSLWVHGNALPRIGSTGYSLIAANAESTATGTTPVPEHPRPGTP
jgi:hypothetical protein